jgi:hypothetical protein
MRRMRCPVYLINPYRQNLYRRIFLSANTNPSQGLETFPTNVWIQSPVAAVQLGCLNRPGNMTVIVYCDTGPLWRGRILRTTHVTQDWPLRYHITCRRGWIGLNRGGNRRHQSHNGAHFREYLHRNTTPEGKGSS